MAVQPPNTHQEALWINLAGQAHGTFAEIGAGQEVAPWFFLVGGAAATVAKTISAYDMAFSDAIYGATAQYVSRSRLTAMLEHEYELLLQRLAQKRGATTSFFVFADTVATRSFSHREDGQRPGAGFAIALRLDIPRSCWLRAVPLGSRPPPPPQRACLRHHCLR